MEWPARRFERAYEYWSRRKLIEEVDARHRAHITGIFANSNYDSQKEGEEGPRRRLLESVGEYYEKLKAAIWNEDVEERIDPEVEAAMDSPFMRASKRNVARAVQQVQMPGEEQVKSYFSS